ncbi:MAG: Trk system potassium transporter TrkA [Bacteroidaceae bacterium]|nr:Trk system potassium transporter TrkA [Bacteroidaceae bacterium]MDE7167173.1 Trk system potassium transporter TrkA [Bacteroidaceae bacterium]
MKIIIAGAGAVGTHLAQLLSRDAQDIVVIDESQVKTDKLTDSGNYDLMTVNLSPSSIAAMKESGVQHADLFIAVTPDEARNITCCMLAHILGARKTVARVDNAEYVSPQYIEIFQRMGIDSLIYPEVLAADEIVEGLKHSWVRQYWEIHEGALIMMGIKLRETATILDKSLRELCPPDAPYHIVAIKRGNQTIIPGGNDELQLGDIAYFITTRKYISFIRELVGKEDYPDVKRVMVMGGGRISVQLARRKPDWLSMKIVERNEERCYQLNEILENDDIVVIHGDGRDTDTLIDEGIRKFQAFAALTPETETNILACLAAKRLGVRKTVALVENTDYIDMAEKLDIGTIINKKSIAAGHIYRMMLDADVTTMKSLTIANADVAEFVALEGSLITQGLIREQRFPKGVSLGGLIRDKIGMPINGSTQIQPGDSVVVFAIDGLVKQMDRFFRKPEGGLIANIINRLT